MHKRRSHIFSLHTVSIQTQTEGEVSTGPSLGVYNQCQAWHCVCGLSLRARKCYMDKYVGKIMVHFTSLQATALNVDISLPLLGVLLLRTYYVIIVMCNHSLGLI